MIAQRVQDRARRMGIELDDRAARRFEQYLDMLTQKNKHMNLTAVLEPEEAVDRHFLDSLAPIAQGLIPQGASLVDVGTGAGFPGLALLIARPDIRLTLVDALGKRLTFLQEVLDALDLKANIVHARAEDFSRSAVHREQYDIAAARAVASLSPLMEYLLPCVRVGGLALCWKGPAAVQEAAESERALDLLGGAVRGIVPYEIPDRDWQYSLILVEKQKRTPKTYPRKAGTPTKNPL